MIRWSCLKPLIAAALLTSIAAPAQDLSSASFEFVHNIAGNRQNEIRGVAAGPDGSIYAAGLTSSSDFITTPRAARPASANRGGYEVFLLKLSGDGKELIYSTLLGPTRAEWPVAMGVDATGNAYVAYRPELGDAQAARSLEPAGALAIVKVSPEGDRFLYRVSVLPEASYGPPIGMAVDKGGSVYIASGDSSFGVRKIDPDGNRIDAQTKVACREGTGLRVNALTLGADNSVYLAGRSGCSVFPATPNAYRASASTNPDAFVMRLAPNLASTVYATLVGGDGNDEALALTVGNDGNATTAGQTTAPMTATFLGMPPPRPAGQYGFVATLSPDGTTLKGAALLPSNTATAVASDSEGVIYVGGSSPYSAMLAKISPDLQTLRYIVDAPARNARIASVNVWNGKFLFGGSTTALQFPNNDPGLTYGFSGFIGMVASKPLKANLQVDVQAALTIPEIYGSYTACRYVLTNRGPNDASRLLLAAGIQGNASFDLWRADPTIFNVPTFWTGFGGPSLTAVNRLGAGESATIEFLSGNSISPDGIRCSGRIYSETADEDLSDNEASSSQAPHWVKVSISAPRGIGFRRDDWPVLFSPWGVPLDATPNSQMRIYFPSPQKDMTGRMSKFERWTDGTKDNPRVFAVGEQNFSANASFSIVSDGTPESTDLDGGATAPSAQAGETPLYIKPSEMVVGTANPVIVVNGTGLQADWEVLWNGESRPTTYLSSYQLRVALRPEDVGRLSLSWVSVRDPGRNVIVRAPHPFWVHLALPNNDVIYDKSRSRLWVAAPSPTETNQHRIALVNPDTGEIEQAIAVSTEPQKLALTDDGRYLYVAVPGRIQRLDTEALTIDQDFAIPPTDVGSLPPRASSMLAVPGHPDRVLVSVNAPGASPGYRGTILFDNGVAAKRRLAPFDGPSLLYGWVDDHTVVGGDYRTLYYAVVDDGIEMQRVIKEGLTSAGCVLETGLLYCGSGTVLDAATGSFVRQYPARGAVGVAAGADRVVFFDYATQITPSGQLFGPMVTVRQSTGEFVSGVRVPFGGNPGALAGWGENGLVYRPTGSSSDNYAAGLYIFRVP